MGTGQLILLQVLNTAVIIGTLMLVALGLGIIYGLMDVLNLAHGAFLMVGAYGVVVAASLGLDSWEAMAVGVLVAAALGFVVERGLIRWLYRRPLDSLLATWGLSLILIQTVQLIFGPAPKYVSVPIQGAVPIFGVLFPEYNLFIIGASIVVTVFTLALFRYPTFGVKTRAVLQDAEMAKCLGIRAPRIYALSFTIGAGLAGLAGGLIAPLVSVQPQMGTPYLVNGFLTVIVGGVGRLIGVVGGSGVIGGSQGVIAYFSSSVMAQVIALAVAIVAVRLRPQGIFPRK